MADTLANNAVFRRPLLAEIETALVLAHRSRVLHEGTRSAKHPSPFLALDKDRVFSREANLNFHSS